MNVGDYMARIHSSDEPEPTLAALRRLHARHVEHVPFENLDIHLGVPIVLDEQAILDKVVLRRRGGFCYELNTAFAWLLRRLGFRVSVLSAEVARPGGGFEIPYDHMTLRVDLSENSAPWPTFSWLADVGFGESVLLPLDEAGSGGDYRLETHGTWWHLSHRDEPKYRFTLEPRELSDFDGACQYHQSSTDSAFTQKIVMTRATPVGRITLSSDRLIQTAGDARTETPLNGEGAWLEALERHFHIHLERHPCSNV